MVQYTASASAAATVNSGSTTHTTRSGFGAVGGEASATTSGPSTRPGAAKNGETATVNFKRDPATGYTETIVSFEEYGGASWPMGEPRRQLSRDGVGEHKNPAGTYLPSAYFRRIEGTVVDTNGDAIETAGWVVAADSMPQAAPVDPDGTFELFLLRQRYENFLLMVPNPRPGPDVVFRSPEGVAVSILDETVELTFRRERIPGGSTGLSVGSGVDIG